MRPPTRVLWGIAVVLLGCLGGLLVMHSRSLALALALALLVVSLGFARVPGRTRFFGTPRPFRWIPAAWCLLFFVSNVKTDASNTFRDASSAAGGSLSSENRIELTAYLLVALVVVVVWFHLRPRRSAVNGWPLYVWPSFALISTGWSPIPLFTFVRASQLLIVVALALLCLRLAHSHPGLGRPIVVDALRLFVSVTAMLSLWGLVDQSNWDEGRFMWPTGPHPIVVGMFVGAALLIVLVGGTSLTRFPRSLHVSLVVLFSLVLLLGQNRSILISTGLGLLISLWTMRSRSEVWARYIAVPALLWAGLAFALLAGQTFLTYFARGESSHTLSTLTGRTDLWATALRQLKTPTEWLFGFGYGSPRVILERLFEWAGQAHSSFVELLLAVGLIGAGAAVVSIVAVGNRALSARHANARVAGAVGAGLFAYLVVMGMVEAVLVIPGLGFSMFSFVFFAACSQSIARSQSHRGRLEVEELLVRRASPVAR